MRLIPPTFAHVPSPAALVPSPAALVDEVVGSLRASVVMPGHDAAPWERVTWSLGVVDDAIASMRSLDGSAASDELLRASRLARAGEELRMAGEQLGEVSSRDAAASLLLSTARNRLLLAVEHADTHGLTRVANDPRAAVREASVARTMLEGWLVDAMQTTDEALAARTATTLAEVRPTIQHDPHAGIKLAATATRQAATVAGLPAMSAPIAVAQAAQALRELWVARNALELAATAAGGRAAAGVDAARAAVDGARMSYKQELAIGRGTDFEQARRMTVEAAARMHDALGSTG